MLHKNSKLPQAAAQYARQPEHVGKLLKQKAEAKGWKPKMVAQKLGKEVNSIHRIYRQPDMAKEGLVEWSELLQENLLLLYSPNVPPQPDPCVQLLNQIAALKEELNEKEDKLAAKQAFILKLEGKVEELEDIMRDWLKRRG